MSALHTLGVREAADRIRRRELSSTDLDHILQAFERLQAVDTTDVPPTAHIEDFGAFLRPDEVLNPHGDERLLANAPARDGRLFRVPRIIE